MTFLQNSQNSQLVCLPGRHLKYLHFKTTAACFKFQQAVWNFGGRGFYHVRERWFIESIRRQAKKLPLDRIPRSHVKIDSNRSNVYENSKPFELLEYNRRLCCLTSANIERVKCSRSWNISEIQLTKSLKTLILVVSMTLNLIVRSNGKSVKQRVLFWNSQLRRNILTFYPTFTFSPFYLLFVSCYFTCLLPFFFFLIASSLFLNGFQIK